MRDIPYLIPYKSEHLANISYNYDYPINRDLRPRSVAHDRIINFIMERAIADKGAMSRRYESWRDIDRSLTVYMSLDENETKLKANDPRKPVSIVVPMSYSIRETLVTYTSSVFLDDPYFKFHGTGPEDYYGAILLEQLIQQQCIRSKVSLNVITQMKDAFAYGIGCVSPIWCVKKGPARRASYRGPRLVTNYGLEGYEEEDIISEGNKLININPFNFLPDPNVSIDRVQDGEFVGWMTSESCMNLISREYYDDTYFNCQYIKHIDGSSVLNGRFDTYIDRYDVGERLDSWLTKSTDVIYMYVTIIPKDLELSPYDRPQKWLFGVAGDEILIRCQPSNLYHGDYPIAVAAPDFDGYTISPISRLEIAAGMQEVQNFLFNSHIANVRKAVNDVIIYDPTVINPYDIERSEAGLRVRTRKKAWGMKITDSVMQLPINDVTRSNIQDAIYASDQAKITTGAPDNLQGQVRAGGERRSATEMRDARASALSRLDLSSRIIGAMSMQDIGKQFAYNTQQFMSRESYVRATGRWEEVLTSEFGAEASRGYILVNPMDLAIAFDILVDDKYSMETGDPNVMLQMMQLGVSNPLIMQELDILRMYKRIARASGFKDVSDFFKRAPAPQAQVMPMEQIQPQVQAGNLVSIEDYLGAHSNGEEQPTGTSNPYYM